MSVSKELQKQLEDDDIIFHYTKSNIFLEKIMASWQLKLSSFSECDDPLENKKIILGVTGNGRPNTKIIRNLDKANRVFNQIVKQETGLICFCQNRINTNLVGYKKSRMWSQYGEKHRGVCIALSKKKLLTFFSKKIKKHNFFYNEEVNYNREISHIQNIPWLTGSDLSSKKLEEKVITFINDNYKQIYFTKHIDYLNEDEFRIVIGNYHDALQYFDIETSIHSIILGNDFPSIYRPLVKDFCNEIHSNYLRLNWHNGRIMVVD